MINKISIYLLRCLKVNLSSSIDLRLIYFQIPRNEDFLFIFLQSALNN
ncbi:hypothetical protein SynROS8604_00237 [Synechococcus sp. ROS8604]|nr:hypothetical protein SynROS8604_00237 [Synechococcus sp. ROS8604]